MTNRAASRLPLHLASAYTLLAVYGSLYPFTGWRDTGIDPFTFLFAGWPRYFTHFDLIANALAYLPFGFLWATAFMLRVPALTAFATATLWGTGLSLGIEMVQNYLPSRVPSNLDLACNATGSLIGAALGMLWGRELLDGGRLHVWRERRFLSGHSGDLGLLLVAFWFLTQLNPETFLFGSGNLRGLIGLPAALPFAAENFTALETLTVAAQTFAIALIGSRLAANHPLLLPPVLIGAALLIKSFAIMVLMNGVHGLAWATPGSLTGLGLGILFWITFAPAPPIAKQTAAALALMFATVLANLMPDNPYLEDTLRVWQQGHFFNFNGLTRLVTSLWPFLALPWLMLSRSSK